MANRPGSLAGLTTLFAHADVNIVGIASEVRDDSGLVRIAVEGEGDTSGILSRAGFASVESRLLSVEAEDTPGKLAEISKRLADSGINITTVYGTALGTQVSRILIAVENTDDAFKILGAGE
ncbi:MAG: hypothetical protein COB53_06265 [Elusimicrobia bacterium]|nr:MAG: hypothetical protein COB53_06265 [Elusimicrobiota bacterium]